MVPDLLLSFVNKKGAFIAIKSKEKLPAGREGRRCDCKAARKKKNQEGQCNVHEADDAAGKFTTAATPQSRCEQESNALYPSRASLLRRHGQTIPKSHV